MIVNNKFKPLPTYPEVSPIKKTYDYYKEPGNLWNSKYLSSKKISRYYLDSHQSFMSGPNSPQNQSIQDSLLQSQKYALKAQIHKKESKDLLNKRKIERLQLSNTLSSINSQKVKSEFNQSGAVNVWGNFNNIPESRLKHVIPLKLVEKDKEGIDNILNKSGELSKLNDWNNGQAEIRKLKNRMALITRHNDQELLERKSGIQKVRIREASQGVFGYTKQYKFTEKTEFLSRPKKNQDTNNFIHKDFRGLLHADYPQVVQKLHLSSEIQRKPHYNSESSCKDSVKKELLDIIKFEED